MITDGNLRRSWTAASSTTVRPRSKIVGRPLEEADACRRDGITITTFMITTDTYLVEFVEKLKKINRGRAYYASPYNWRNSSSRTTQEPEEVSSLSGWRAMHQANTGACRPRDPATYAR
jgi:hypothetical protein